MTFLDQADETLDLGLVSKVFLLLSAGSLLVIPIDGFWIAHNKPEIIHASPATVSASSFKPEPKEAYLTAFDRSSLFGTVSSGASGQALSASMAQLTKDYRLKGVVLASESEAIIENASTQKTLFVKVGATLGDLTVKEIKEGLIILSYLDQETKLEIQ